MHAYDFWAETGTASGAMPPLATLSLYSKGRHSGNELQMLFRSEMPIEQQLAVADRVLAGVQQWRDGIAEYAERQRTAADELAAAHAEIARLKAEAGEAS
ncbi:hypothetical protein ACFUJR_07225 [Streptomyces sp. NPDC057271]|uniref:hypothetical protein n=1 Tax=unclassified Streptomyces TaxID=2593676 RepID=UPI0036293DD7